MHSSWECFKRVYEKTKLEKKELKDMRDLENMQEKMDPEQRNAYKTLLKELENNGEEATPARQILQLALQLDEKGEFYKFIEVFGNGRIDDKNDIRLPGNN